MNGESLRVPSRRDLLRGMASAGLVVPFAVGKVASAYAEEDATDYHSHLAVGVWVEESDGFPFAYQLVIGNGTLIYYNGYPNVFPPQSPSNLPVFGFGVWKPTGPRSTEGFLQIAWGDTSVRTLFTISARSTLAEGDDDRVFTEYREREVSAFGRELFAASGSGYARRMKWVPFDAPMPEATPTT